MYLLNKYVFNSIDIIIFFFQNISAKQNYKNVLNTILYNIELWNIVFISQVVVFSPVEPTVMEFPDTQYRVHSDMCPGDTEYFWKICSWDLCLQCKVNHINDLKTIHQNRGVEI